MHLNDYLFTIEADLAKYPGTDAEGALNRRIILRKALTGLWAAARQEGYSDGLRDASDARVIAQLAEDARRQQDADAGAVDGVPGHG